MSSYKSFAFTISRKEGFEGEMKDYTVKWLRKQDYAFAVIENKEGHLHCHGQIWNETASRMSDKLKQLRKKVAQLSPDSIMCYAWKAKIAYSDGYLDYMNKEIIETLDERIPKGDTTCYYPTEEEQERVKAEAQAVDKKFYKWELDFLASKYNDDVIEYQNIAQFLEDMMFSTRLYPVIICPKRRRENAKALYLYVTKSTNGHSIMSEEEKKPKTFGISNDILETLDNIK